MKIKFLRQWHQFTIGTVTETLGEGVCAELVRRGFAKAVAVAPKNKQLATARNK